MHVLEFDRVHAEHVCVCVCMCVCAHVCVTEFDRVHAERPPTHDTCMCHVSCDSCANACDMQNDYLHMTHAFASTHTNQTTTSKRESERKRKINRERERETGVMRMCVYVSLCVYVCEKSPVDHSPKTPSHTPPVSFQSIQ